MVVTFCSEPADEGNAYAAAQGPVDACFIFQLRMFGLDGLELDGNFVTRDYVGTL